MTDSAPPFIECEQVHAGLAVIDIGTAVEFYTKKLGFAAAFTWGDPPTFAGVNLDKVQMFLRKGTPDRMSLNSCLEERSAEPQIPRLRSG
jgi:catechol 2,3-dioxygenase-like lactoylglutathione lyase family enzyme